MKQYPEEQLFLEQYLQKLPTPHFTDAQLNSLQKEIRKIRKEAKLSPWLHGFMQALPFAIIACAWYLLIFILPKFVGSTSLLFVLTFALHGVLGYQWVVYGLHEGAGHGLFPQSKFLRFMAFHSSRIMMADPVHYRNAHSTHHRFLGSERDEAQTNFVLLRRVLVSILPGAGILFPNDYRIHKGDGFSRSLLLSSLIGFVRIYIEYRALKSYFSTEAILLMLLVLSPWVGLSLDRIRESLEHHLMPRSKTYGTRELGLSPLGLLIAGGPWGQPCHMSHHLAPDFKWHQQLRLHQFLKSLLDREQRAFFGFSTTISTLLKNEWKKHLALERA